MSLDPATASAIAAVIVASVAFVVALAQVIQQYFVTGQLIRICDSVVYGKMPGQGHRVWEFSQFRFRVVYSIPQISLPFYLWSHNGWRSKEKFTLPDLDPSTINYANNFQEVSENHSGLQMLASRSTIRGEASWASFSRTVQYSCGGSLRYDMVEGDADRCPSDLPVVPMQLSMRDVIALAMMAGMECTDASFTNQSLSMQGTAGSITSSRHPVLGALIHFAPKRPFETHGLRINNGTISPHWMARMRDIVVVAGCQYAFRDRKHFEEDEGPWIRLSGDRSVVHHPKTNLERPQIESTLRKRLGTGVSPAPDQLDLNDKGITKIASRVFSGDDTPANSTDDLESDSLHRQQDGQWSFANGATKPEISDLKDEDIHLLPIKSTDPRPSFFRGWLNKPGLSSLKRLAWKRKTGLSRRSTILPMTNSTDMMGDSHGLVSSVGASREKINTNMTDTGIFPPPTGRTTQSVQEVSRQSPSGDELRDYIKEKQKVHSSKNDSHNDLALTPRRLLLLQSEESNQSETSLQYQDKDPLTEQEKKLASLRTEQVIRKWKEIVKKRQQEREKRSRREQDQLQRKASIATNGTGAVQDRRRHSFHSKFTTGPSNTSRSRSRGTDHEKWTERDEPGHANLRNTRQNSAHSWRSRRSRGASPTSSLKSNTETISRLQRQNSWNRSVSPMSASRSRSTRRSDYSRRHRWNRSPSPSASLRTSSRRLSTHSRQAERRNEPDSRSVLIGAIADLYAAQLSRNERSSSSRGFDRYSSTRRRRRRSQSPVDDAYHRFDPARSGPRGRRRNSSVSPASKAAPDFTQPIEYGEAPIHPAATNVPVAPAQQPPGPLRRARFRVDSPSQNESSLDSDVPKAPHSTGLEPVKGVLRPPKTQFPEDPNPIREGVAPLKGALKKVPANARWTKIDRKLVNEEALKLGNERYEARDDSIIVLRVLTKDEIEAYAEKTLELRNARTSGRGRSSSVDSADSFERVPQELIERSLRRRENLGSNGSDPDGGRESGRISSLENIRIDTNTEDVSNNSEEQRISENSVEYVAYPSSPKPRLATSFPSDDSESAEVERVPGPLSDTQSSESRDFERELRARDALWESPDIPGAVSARQRSNASKHGSLGHELWRSHDSLRRTASVPTTHSVAFEDELKLIKCESIFKKMRERINQCKDIYVALKVFRDRQEDEAHLPGEVTRIHEHVHNLNVTLKKLLKATEPHLGQERMVELVISELEILVWSLGQSLSVLEADFGLFDIEYMDADRQRDMWNDMTSSFEAQYSCSLLDHLQINTYYGSEVLTNFNEGRPSSTASNEWKMRIPGQEDLPTDSFIIPLFENTFNSLPTTHHTPRSSDDFESQCHHSDASISSASASESSDDRDWPSMQDSAQHQLSPSEAISASASVPTGPNSRKGEMNWLWICQMDTIPGYFATPWKHLFNENVCVGAISVILKALEAFTDASTLQYVGIHPQCRDWIRAGKCTYPSYAINAHGGVVVPRAYQAVRYPALSRRIPPIELLASYEHQVARAFAPRTQTAGSDLAELMGLDSWLALCGRLPEIYDGRSSLLRTAPALVQRLMTDFELEFASLDRSTTNGGLPIIREIAESLGCALVEEKLSLPERLFALVALLRAAKTALCVALGMDTAMVREVFLHDVQMYMA